MCLSMIFGKTGENNCPISGEHFFLGHAIEEWQFTFTKVPKMATLDCLKVHKKIRLLRSRAGNFGRNVSFRKLECRFVRGNPCKGN